MHRLPSLPQPSPAYLSLPQPTSAYLGHGHTSIQCIGNPAYLSLPQRTSAYSSLPRSWLTCWGLLRTFVEKKIAPIDCDRYSKTKYDFFVEITEVIQSSKARPFIWDVTRLKGIGSKKIRKKFEKKWREIRKNYFHIIWKNRSWNRERSWKKLKKVVKKGKNP